MNKNISLLEKQKEFEYEDLINSYMPLVKKIAKKYSDNDYFLEDDLVGVGITEFWRCYNKYNENIKSHFNTYVTNCIEHKIKSEYKKIKCLKMENTRASIFNIASNIIEENKDKDVKYLYDIVKSRCKNIKYNEFISIYNMKTDKYLEFNNLENIFYNNIENLICEKIDIRNIFYKIDNIRNVKNKEVYIEYINSIIDNNEISISELAKNHNLSRQYVSKLIKDMNNKLIVSKVIT